jgi:TRAP-type C4-dicarboxylate transport system permease small subunit
VRRLLDGVYRICGGAAAFFVFMITALVVAQVGGRLAGVLVPGADDLAGYALTASSFLALAHTLRAGGHIRLTMLIRKAGRGQRRLLEAGCLTFAALVTGYFTYHVVDMAWDAYRFGERSQGILSVPLWIPQSVMALGAVVLFVAFVDDLVVVVRGGVPSYERAAADLTSVSITREG